MTVRVAVDYRMSRASGIGVYLRSIVRELVDAHRDIQVSLVGGDDVPGVVAHYPCRSPIFSLAELVEVPLRIPRPVDVFWSPNYNAPLASPGRLVVTIHDANHLALPGLLDSSLKRAYARAMFRNVRRRARRVIAVSRFTAAEVTALAGIAPSRITVIHSGAGNEWTGAAAGGRAIPEPYILFVGNVKPHKNLGRLLSAFARLAGRIPHRLVIVGKRDGFITPDREIMALAERMADRVAFTGEASDDALRGYYAGADLLVYPSLYEGFGFPPLEALRAGVPVAASNAASIPEICGDAAEYFDPYSIDDMARAIDATLTDAALRARLRERGPAQAAKYSWARAAAAVAGVFREVAAS